MSDSNQFSLLKERRFAPFFGTQFLGAFNDNIFRNGLIILITFQGVKVFGLNVSDLANVAAGLFMLPFFLFSATAGQIADKYEKSRLIRIYKTIEIGLMLLASVAFVTQSYQILFLLLFLMGCQSTFFGPVKYAYLPQHLATGELIGGNAMVESGTYVAIMLGLVVGGLSVAVDPDTLYVLVSFLIGIAVVGYFTSRAIPETKAVDPELRINWNLITESKRIIGFARVDRNVFLSILGISWFWFFGSAMTVQIPAYTLNILNGNEEITTLILVVFAFGVGAGSLLCERLSGQKVELGLVPFGSIGLSVFAIDLYFAQSTLHPEITNTVSDFFLRPGSIRIFFDIAMIGAFGGLYSVPLYALVQQRSKRQQLSRIIAATNILNSLFIVCSAILAIILLGIVGMTIPQFFVVLGILNAIVAIYIYSLIPEFLMRFIAWVIVNTLYRIRTTGREKIPNDGPALLVCNHVSYIDALVIGGSIRRPARFVMWYKIFETPFVSFMFRHAKAIPIASAKEGPAILEQAMDSIDQALADDNIVCIFPEGRITTDGEVQSFRAGVEKIVARRAVPVIPIGLGGLWGSWFSRRANGSLQRLPGKLLAQVNIRIGEPVQPNDATAEKLELLVRSLRGQNR